MKKLVRLLVIGVLLQPVAGLSAQDWGSLYAPGNVAVSAGAGILAFRQGVSLAAYPAAEVIVYEFVIAETVPLEVGVAARGLVSLFNAQESWGSYGWLAFGGGAFGSAHFTFRDSDLDLPAFFENLDFYSALGLAYTAFTYTGDWGTLGKYAETGLGFASYAGFSYFLKEKLALYVEGAYWDYGGGATVGALLKL
jgi:hypothetical protein